MMDDRNDQPDSHPFDGLAPGAIAPEVHEGAAAQLALDEDERLPWLESADDDDDDAGTVDTARLMRFVVFGLILLAAVGGGLWFLDHHSANGPAVADGSVIKAPAEPYKQVPTDKGGKTFAGTGDSAFAVSEGKTTPARLGGGEAPVASPTIDTSAGAAGDAGTGGVGVQVGAYSSQATAEAGWTRLSGSNEALKGVKHRVVEGSADIGTVYRLQAVATDAAGANALCASLKAGGIPCQVKR